MTVVHASFPIAPDGRTATPASLADFLERSRPGDEAVDRRATLRGPR